VQEGCCTKECGTPDWTDKANGTVSRFLSADGRHYSRREGPGRSDAQPGADNRKLMAQLNRGRDAPINPDWKRRGASVRLLFVRATTCQAQGLRFRSVVAK
jgi:hypothetical protein